MECRITPVLDELIAERAPWFFKRTIAASLARTALKPLLRYDETVRIAKSLEHETAHDIFHAVGERLARQVSISGVERIPASGPALIVCNHPTGIADGLILNHALMARRPDVYFFANRDIIRVFPQMEDKIAPVEWRPEKRSHAGMREVITYVRAATETGRLGIIFPSGRLAKRRGLQLTERPWMASAAMLARKFELPVVPVHITARNSLLFYLFDLIHPTLRDITLFHETLNKDQFAFDIRVGKPVPGCELDARSEVAIADLRTRTLALASDDDRRIYVTSTGRPGWIASPRQSRI